LTSSTPHPSPDEFLSVVRGEAPPEVARAVVRHLLDGCAQCAQSSDGIRSSPEKANLEKTSPTGPYDAVLDKVTRRVIDHKRSLHNARILALELMAHPAVEGLGQIHSTRRYATLALCELLLKKARQGWMEGTGLETSFTRLAAGIAEQLDLDVYGSQVIPDVRASPWAYMVNAHRLQADVETAENTLALVRAFLESRRKPAESPGLFSLSASLRLDQGRFDEAAQWMNRLASVYRRQGDAHGLGRVMIRKSCIRANQGQAASALRLLRRGGALVDVRREPRLAIYANHALIWHLSEQGSYEESQDVLGRARRLYRQHGDHASLARLRWLEGKIAQSRGETEEAEEAFSDARVRLGRAGLGYETGLAAMDVAFLYAYQGRADRMRRQAEQLMPLFKSQQMYGETMVALEAYRRHADAKGKPRRPEDLLKAVEGYLEMMRRRKNTLQIAPERGGKGSRKRGRRRSR